MAHSNADWEAVERAYRAGILSIREIARQHGVTDKAVRNRAKLHSWPRDLTARVKEKARADLVRGQVRKLDARTETEIVAEAAAQVVGVVQLHRRDIAAARGIVERLFGELRDESENKDVVADAIIEETADDISARRRQMLQKAVSLPARAAIARDLATATSKLVGMERQAHSIDDGSGQTSYEDALKELYGSD